jgi:PhoPQ-activated pathogenicity-related protein
MPKFTWTGLKEGTFTITPVGQKPVAVKLWTATNPAARDFRETAGITWSAITIEENAQGAYNGAVENPPAGGYTAFYVELTYQDGERGAPAYSLATPITILGN